jgi:hypothetical protein
MYPRKPNLASREVLHRLVRDSIARAIEISSEGALVETLAFELGRAIRREVARDGRALRGATRDGLLTELEQTNEAMLAERERAAAELAEVQSELALHRAMLDDAHGAMVRRADADAPVMDEELRGALVGLFDRAAAGELSLEELRAATLERVRQASDASRDAMLAAWSAERDKQVDQLRRRLDKLNRSLAASEQALGRLAAQREIDPGIASIYRTVQGLDEMTQDASRKRLMLAEIYEANLALQKRREPA